MKECKTVLIAGINGLIGRNILEDCLKKYEEIIGIDIKFSKEVISLAKENNILLIECNLLDQKNLINILQKFPKINAAVNLSYPRNSQYGEKPERVSTESFIENTSLILGSTFNFINSFHLRFQENKKPISIINFSSIYGVIAPRFEIYDGTKMTMPVEYAAAKSAIISLTKYYANYVNNTDFKINCISPGGILADQDEEFINAYRNKTYGSGLIPAGQMAKIISFLISDESKYINGQNIIVDDGFTNK